MALTRYLPIVLLLFAIRVPTGSSEVRVNFYFAKCYPPPTPTEDGGSAFHQNLLNLLEILPNAAAPMGFPSLQTAGTAVSDRAFVRGFCDGDSAPEQCRRCLTDAGKKITVQCGDASRRASFWDVLCFLGYADGANSSSAVEGDDFGAVVFSGGAVPSPDIISVQKLVALAQSLAPRVAGGSVATADATTPAIKGDAAAGNRMVHVLAQCAMDRGSAECVGCVRKASLAMETRWEAEGGARGRVVSVLGLNCYLRFEISSSIPLLPLGEMIKTSAVTYIVVGVLIGMLIG